MAAAVVRVVVPAYNAERYLTETLESVLAQTFTAWDCVVVDDGSTDGTAALVARLAQRDDRVQLLEQPNSGPSAARNRALRDLPASVRFIAYLDADDTWLPQALARLVAALEPRPDAVGAYGLAEYMDEHGTPVRPGEHPGIQRDRRRVHGHRLEAVGARAPMDFDELVVGSALWPAAVGLFRREAVERAGGFDETMVHVEDWDCYLRMARHGRYLPIDEQVAWYRQHPAQLTRGHVDMAVQYDRVRRQAWESPDNTPAQRTAARRAWRLIHVRRTLHAAQRLLVAVRARRLGDAAKLVLGTATLAVQDLGLRPPRPSARVIALIHPELTR